MSNLWLAPMDVEPDESDHTPEMGDQARSPHTHYCIVCDADWGHVAGDEGCDGGGRASTRDCPRHDERSRLI